MPKKFYFLNFLLIMIFGIFLFRVIKNPNLLNLELYKDHYTPENFQKIKKLFLEYSAKYQNFLK